MKKANFNFFSLFPNMHRTILDKSFVFPMACINLMMVTSLLVWWGEAGNISVLTMNRVIYREKWGESQKPRDFLFLSDGEFPHRG